MTSAKLLLTVA